MDEDFFALLLQGILEKPVRLLLPRAPHPVPGLDGDRAASSWYDYDGNQPRFLEELGRTEALVLEAAAGVERELDLTPRRRYVVGFSQGGYCGSYLALRHPEVFAGMAIVGARVKTEVLEEEIPRAAAAGFRALLCHGRQDASVRPEAAERSREGLAAGGMEVELRWFDSGHTLGRRQAAAIGDWLHDEETRREGGDR
jgi:phospholipase/carboxylesterase